MNITQSLRLLFSNKNVAFSKKETPYLNITHKNHISV